MISLEDRIFEFSRELSEKTSYNEDIIKFTVNDEFYIIASHVLIENDECVYNIVLYNNNEEIIDSVYCNINLEDIEDIIVYLVEEYIEL